MSKDDVQLKIERADKHIQEFQSVLDAFKSTKPYEVGGKRNPHTREFIYYIKKAEPIPPDLSIIAGDVLQNLRTALDYLVCSLVRARNPNASCDKTAFPIFDAVPTTKKDQARFTGKIDGMADQAKNIIRNIKPYKGGDDVLWRLHALNNRDKHRLLLTVGTTVRPFNLGEHFRATRKNIIGHVPDTFVGPSGRIFPLKVGTELLIDTPDAEENKNINLVIDIALNEPGVCKGEPIFMVLRSSFNRVREIVRDLAAFR